MRVRCLINQIQKDPLRKIIIKMEINFLVIKIVLFLILINFNKFSCKDVALLLFPKKNQSLKVKINKKIVMKPKKIFLDKNKIIKKFLIIYKQRIKIFRHKMIQKCFNHVN
jgi:hypothetical protein